jgi:hypothetical protein
LPLVYSVAGITTKRFANLKEFTTKKSHEQTGRLKIYKISVFFKVHNNADPLLPQNQMIYKFLCQFDFYTKVGKPASVPLGQ